MLIGLIAKSLYYDRNYTYDAGHYQGRADERIAFECAETVGVARDHCEAEILEAEAKNYRDHQDLYAQNDMSNWAFGMLVVSLFSLAATVVGIFYVRQTLHQAVAANEAAIKAVEITRDVGINQLRAWLGFSEIRLHGNMGENGIEIVHFLFVWKNTGPTPALNARMVSSYGVAGDAPIFPSFGSDVPPNSDNIISATATLTPDQVWETKVTPVRFNMSVVYNTVFAGVVGRSDAAFVIQFIGRMDRLALARGDFKLENFAFVSPYGANTMS